jgi:hypothetical protein
MRNAADSNKQLWWNSQLLQQSFALNKNFAGD